MLCGECEQEMIRIDFNTGFYIHQCGNWQCQLYAHPQVHEPKNPEETPKPAQTHSNHYDNFKAQKRENYRLLRDLGIAPQEASLMSGSNTKTQTALSRGNNE